MTNITTPLLALLDVAVTGHMGSPVFIAAIALGGTMFNMLYWLFGFLRMGTSGMTAQAFGRGDRRQQAAVLHQGLAVALVIGLLILVLRKPVCDLGLWLMDADGEVMEQAQIYFLVCSLGAPAVLATYTMTGWLLGMQDSKACMWVSLLINVANIATSLVLVYVFGLGIRGVAVGTMSAQWLGAVAAALYCRGKGGFAKLRERVGVAAVPVGAFFKVNVFIFLRTLCLIAVTVWFTRVGASQGTLMLAVNTLLMQFFILFSYFIDGFAYAAEALVGRYVGAADREALRSCLRELFSWGSGIAVGFSVVYFAGGEWILQVLSDDRAVVDGAMEFLPWTVVVPLAGMGAFIWDGVYIGATATRGMLVAMLVAMVVYFLSYMLLFPVMGNHGLWLSFCLYLGARSLVQTLVRRRCVGVGRG